MTVSLPQRTETLVERRAAELGLTPAAYLERLVILDAEGDALEEALLEAGGDQGGEDQAGEWDWDGMLARGLARARRRS